MSSPAQRARENVTGIVTTLVTGIWMAGLFTGQGWWLAALIVGYAAVVPITAILFGDEEEYREHWDEEATGHEQTTETAGGEGTESSDEDPLETLRDRYARGELTDEQFERKLERLLETETLEDVEDRARAMTESEREGTNHDTDRAGTEDRERARNEEDRRRAREPERE